ncbi:transposase [Simiduia agarivorans]|uniref:transposase n=1 Tax=Simiduia agarivorans TaxID=447471 RepID=UPI00030E4BD5|nr:transposase [Simiduia agarivorans]
MTNHVHLVVGVSDYPTDVGALMKRLAGRQTRWVNKQERRTGSLWESRYKISPIDTDAYLLQCCRYVDLNPVTAKMVSAAAQYPWSSAVWATGNALADWLDESPVYRALGGTTRSRQQAYERYLGLQGDAQNAHGFIQAAVERNQLTGGQRFIDEVARRTGIRIECRGQGRPAKP